MSAQTAGTSSVRSTFKFDLMYKVEKCTMEEMWATIFVPDYEYVLFADMKLGNLNVRSFVEDKAKGQTTSLAEVSMTDSLIVNWLGYLVTTSYNTTTLRTNSDFSIISTSWAGDNSYSTVATINMIKPTKSVSDADENAFLISISADVKIGSSFVNFISPLLSGFVSGVVAKKFRAMLVHACAYNAKYVVQNPESGNGAIKKKTVQKDEMDLYESAVLQVDPCDYREKQ